MTRTLLILGGTGFLGKSILESFVRGELNRYGITKVKIIARRAEEFRLNFPELINDYIEIFQSDVAQCIELPIADIVIHAATSTDARDYQSDDTSQRLNIETSTLNYCKLATKFHRNAQIVYCSSGAVYGQQPDDLESILETFPFQDVSQLVDYKRDYALGKRLAELEIMRLGRDGLNVSIARCFAFYGKYLPRDQHFAYGNFLGAAERGETIEVHAKHQVIRSYMHADDLVHALIQVALDANPTCPVYNVGSDEPIEIRDLANKIAKQYNVPVKLAPIIDNKIDKYVPNTSKLKTLQNRNT